MLAALIVAGNNTNWTHAAGNNENGKMLFGECKSCHELADKENRIGPHLVGIFGRSAGSVEGFLYSDAMSSSAFSWNEDTLDRYIAAPQNFLEGTRMYFGGIPDPEDRKDLIAFLKTETSDD
ncbi:MAG: hypothetical protein CMM32_09105 [Rhodospirillaceae bacterium]|nr:hypothetical protein [Rhodospirillaceae bacterium]